MAELKECENIIAKVVGEGRTMMRADEAKQVCSLHNIPVPISHITLDVQEAVLQANEMGYPIVLKVISPQIVHKSDVGGVILNIGDERELEIAFEKLVSKFAAKNSSAKVFGILVEKMMQPSTEVIIGAIRDRQFGPSIMFGIGGVFTEIFNDVAFRVAPLDMIDALNLVRGLRGYKILEGVRGKPAADLDSIINVLLSVSGLMMEHEFISQLDLNPVIVYAEGVCAVDCRIVLRSKEGDI
ncbi:TPA: acetyl-CoA synthetase [Candidatus Bathyarchaeota archaeon]|nr:acetyl-CoA synthetase [Candidatus Bathyarchaeota archaeon]